MLLYATLWRWSDGGWDWGVGWEEIGVEFLDTGCLCVCVYAWYA